MNQSHATCKPSGKFKRAVLGFIAGFLLALIVLLMLDQFPERDPYAIDEPEWIWIKPWLIAVAVALGVSVIAIFWGGKRVPRFATSFILIFLLTCMLPFWPGKLGRLTEPLASIYSGYGAGKKHAAEFLIVHLGLSAVAAAVFAWAFPGKRSNEELSDTKKSDTEEPNTAETTTNR